MNNQNITAFKRTDKVDDARMTKFVNELIAECARSIEAEVGEQLEAKAEAVNQLAARVNQKLTEIEQTGQDVTHLRQQANQIIQDLQDAANDNTIPWDRITGKPLSFPPSSHDHDDSYLQKNAQAKDSLKLGGKNASDYLLTTGKAADSNLLDGIDSSGFVQQKQNTLSLQQLNSPNFPQSYVGTTNLGKQIGLPVEWVNIQFVRHRGNGYGTQIAYSTVQSNTQTDTNYFFMAIRSSEAYSWNGWRFIGSHESIAIKDTKLAIRNGHTYVCVWNATVGMPWGDNHDDGVIVPHIGYYNADGSPQWGWQTLYCWNKNEVWVRRIYNSAWQAWEKIPKWGDLESLKQLSVDGKNTHINGINRLMGYNSGLSVNNSWNDVAWWWEHKVLKEKGTFKNQLTFNSDVVLRNQTYNPQSNYGSEYNAIKKEIYLPNTTFIVSVNGKIVPLKNQQYGSYSDTKGRVYFRNYDLFVHGVKSSSGGGITLFFGHKAQENYAFNIEYVTV